MERENFSLSGLIDSFAEMTKTNNADFGFKMDRYFDSVSIRNETYQDYTKEQVDSILKSSNNSAKRKLSRAFFAKEGLYSRLIIHYATLMKNAGVLVPNPSAKQSLQKPHISKKYDEALNFLDSFKLQKFLTDVNISVLVNGVYYGIISDRSKKGIDIMSLPIQYCRSNYTNGKGEPVVEFNLHYFNSFPENLRLKILKTYPPALQREYYKLEKGKINTSYMVLPPQMAVYFELVSQRPILLTTIPAIMSYQEAVVQEREKEKEEIKKIIVEKIPHLADGTLLFEPDEAAEIHRGTVGMMRNNANVSVLTTYADVEAVVSKSTTDNASNYMKRMLDNVYAGAGASQQIFSAVGNLALEVSLKNDLALVMILYRQYEIFITSQINKECSNANINFKYVFLPITHFNESTYAKDALALANGGYSFLVPAIAQGFNQRDFSNIKELENGFLDLPSKMIPLSNAHTLSAVTGVGAGAPKKPTDQLSEKTQKNLESLDGQGLEKEKNNDN